MLSKFLTGKPTGKRPLRRSRCIREDNIRMDPKKTGVNTRNWVDSAQDRDYSIALVKCRIEPQGPISHVVSYLQGEYVKCESPISIRFFCSIVLYQKST